MGVAGAAFGAIMLGMAGGTFAEFERTTDSDMALQLASRGEGQQTVGWLALGVGVAAIAGSVLWLWLGSSPVQPTVAVTPSGANFGVTGSF